MSRTANVNGQDIVMACRRCFFFDPPAGHDREKAQQGACNWGPPVPFLLYEQVPNIEHPKGAPVTRQRITSYPPPVPGEHWCGRFTPTVPIKAKEETTA